jgi:tRNA-specific 2-thiouridylase
MALGFDAVVTGHYAQVFDGPHGKELHRAIDPLKDQSYVLGVLSAEQIAHSMFPLGNSTKVEVRAEAQRRGILVAQKPDSHDICFIPDGDTAGWLAQRIETKPGVVIDAESGSQVGTHKGSQAFTVGQRRGLALGNPTGDGQRRYVVDVDVESNTVFVGPPTLLEVDVIEGVKPRWSGPIPESGMNIEVQIRAHGDSLPAQVFVEPAGVRIELKERIRAVAAGQAAVMYDQTRVIGSATISRSRRRS